MRDLYRPDGTVRRDHDRDQTKSRQENDIIAGKFETVSRLVACPFTIKRKGSKLGQFMFIVEFYEEALGTGTYSGWRVCVDLTWGTLSTLDSQFLMM